MVAASCVSDVYRVTTALDLRVLPHFYNGSGGGLRMIGVQPMVRGRRQQQKRGFSGSSVGLV